MPPSERYPVWRCAENRGGSPVGSAGPNEPPSCTPLIQTAKLNDIDPRRGSPIGRNSVAELLPWNWAANHLPKSRLTAAFAANGSIAVITSVRPRPGGNREIVR